MKRDGCFAGRGAWGRRALVGAAGAVALWSGETVRAGIEFLSSSDVTFRHDPDRESSAVAPRTLELSAIPTSSNLLSFQLNNTFTSGLANTRGIGGFGHVTNPTTATFVIKPGTGVTQDDPGNAAYPGSSSLKINIDTVWDVDSAGFGPLATGYISLAVGGVVGDGGSAKFIANLQFTDSVTNTPLRSDWVVNRTFSDPGAFAKTFTTSEVLATSPSTLGILTGSQRLRVKGYIEFRASNAETPSSIEPLEMEIGGAPPTGSWTGLGANQNWTNPDNWITPDEPNPELLPVVPNASGHRARFISRDGAQRVVNVDQAMRIGTLDVDGSGAFVFQGANKITFDTLQGPAVWNVRNVQGSQEHRMDVLTQLLKPLEIRTDLNAELSVLKQIDGPQMAVTKLGGGRLTLDARNTFSGTFAVRDGVVEANAVNALGTGAVEVEGARLMYNASRAATQGVTVKPGGIVQLGVNPTTEDVFTVRDGGTITGTSEQLRLLTIGGNLTLDPGAVIANTSLSTSPADYPQNLGTTPQYLVGLTKTELLTDLTVGLTTSTAWKGLASGVGAVTLGTSSRVLNLSGEADLLVPTNGTLTIGSRLQTAGTTAATLVKKGAGTVVLASAENAGFNSAVRAGTLLVNGSHPGGIAVEPLGVLGGSGTIGGVVSVSTGGGHIAPGASIGTLTVNKLDLNGTVDLDFELDTPDNHDFIVVQGELVLDGKLNITPLENFAPGRYFLMQYGSLADAGLEIGAAPERFAYNLFTQPRATGGGDLVLDVLGVKQWNVAGSGNWGDPENWLGPVPGASGSRASFLEKGAAGRPSVVSLNGSRRVGRLEFDSTRTYELAPGTFGGGRPGQLLLNNDGSGALVEVNSGRHEISATVFVEDDVEIDVQDVAVLTLSNGLRVNPGRNVRKLSPGRLEVNGAITVDTDARLLVNQGLVRVDAVNGTGSVSIREEATLEIKPKGANQAPSKVFGLTFEGTTDAWRGRLDLQDNELIYETNPLTRDDVLARVTNQIRTARNTVGRRWHGAGIGSSMAAADALTTLAAVLNDRGDGTPILTTLSGGNVGIHSVLVKYTWNGDGNLDGRVNADDYFLIDRGFLAQPANPVFRDGDFNYDGRINADDYFLIDQAFLGQRGLLGDGGGIAGVPVPEPGALLGLGLLCRVLTRGRRRRRRWTSGDGRRPTH